MVKLYGQSIDKFYRALVVFSKFFGKGWGSPDNMRRLFEMRTVFADIKRREAFLEEDHPILIRKEEKGRKLTRLEGEFLSPLASYYPDLTEPPVERPRFELLVPNKWSGPHRPLCIHMAGTGDHNFWMRRLRMARPLALDHGIGSINVMNPYYGERKPKDQFRSSLKNVTDLFVMGGSLIFEGMTLLNWVTKQGYGPLCLSGISMGGHMASLAASHWPRPVALVPCLSWSTASQCFTEGGVLARAVHYEDLAELYFQPQFQRALWLKRSRLMFDAEEYGLGRFFMANYEEQMEEGGEFRWSRHRSRAPSANEKELKHSEVMEFMRGMMDEFTHLGNYPRPVDPSLIIAVEAMMEDAYIPRDGVLDIRELWPGCEVRYFDGGHLTGCLFYTGRFRRAIVDSLDKCSAKYYSAPPIETTVASN